MEIKKDEVRQLLLYSDSLKAIRASEKNRVQSPGCSMITDSISETLNLLDGRIKNIEEMVERIIEEDAEVKGNLDLLVGYKGIGRTTAIKIAYHVPELGKMGKSGIASLCGVAPHANDSGKKHGYRTTKGDGRQNVRTILFFAVLTAVRYNEEMKNFYEQLLANGKKKKVAIIACMRKMIVQLNAILKRGYSIR
jgi:transposase